MSTWKQEAADCHTWIHGRCVEKTAVRGPKKQEERKHCLGVKLLRPDLQHSADRRFPKHHFLGMIKHEYGVSLSGEKFRRCFSFHCCQVNSELRWLTGSECVRYVHRQQLGSIFSLPRPAFSHQYFIEKPERKGNPRVRKEEEHLNNPLQPWCPRPDLKRLKPVRVPRAFKSCCVWLCWDQCLTKWSFKSWLIHGQKLEDHCIQVSVYKNK